MTLLITVLTALYLNPVCGYECGRFLGPAMVLTRAVAEAWVPWWKTARWDDPKPLRIDGDVAADRQGCRSR